MKILVFNPGSNSLKFALIEVEASDPALVRGSKLISGVLEPINHDGRLSFDHPKGIASEKTPVGDYGDAAKSVIGHMRGRPEFRHFDATACRVVHGGGRFNEPVIADEKALAGIGEFEELAPLHNKSSVEVMRASGAALKDLPSIAIFDTDFHKTIPEVAWRYGLGYDLANECGIRRYGFHGISHKYLTLRYAEITKTPLSHTHIVTMHLEGGSSACAVRGGKSIDTSMGFTPLEGLMMGTRCGDIDASVVAYLMKKKNATPAQVDKWMEKESGLLGISGISQDTRVLVKQEDDRAKLALEVFSYRVRKYIGAYLAAIANASLIGSPRVPKGGASSDFSAQGASAVVFGGGIGENTPIVRRAICEGMDALGLEFDAARNEATIDREGVISREDSRVQAWVIPTQENLLMAHEAGLFLANRRA